MLTPHPLAAWLKHASMSRIEFARQVGISPSHLTLVCQNARGVSLKLAKRIEELTGGEVRMVDLVRPRVSRKLTAAE